MQTTPDSASDASIPLQATHDEIAALAQRIYEEEGCVNGNEEAHWLEAERRLRISEDEVKSAAVPQL